jgi:diguanylate cyclase (GGDEF)-like protein
MDDLLNTAPCGFLSSTDDGKIIVINSTLLNILEYQSEELEGRHIESILPIASRVFYQTHLFPLLKMHGKVDEIFLYLQTKSGRDVPMLINAIRQKRKGQIFNNWVFMPMYRRSEYEDQLVRLKKAAEETQKILETKQAELLEVNARLETLTVTDGLTGLKNYRAFQENLGVQIALIKRIPAPLSLLLIDVDYFKDINDTFGHPIGDKYLVDIAQILRRNSREVDFVARYGGEEFAIILPNTDHLNALKTAEKFRKAVESTLHAEKVITISVGVSTFLPEAVGSQAQLISLADQALYLSKERGRNRVTHADDLKSST